jgi:CheY-like chemotaxis protein
LIQSPWQDDGAPGSRFYFELTEFEEVPADAPADTPLSGRDPNIAARSSLHLPPDAPPTPSSPQSIATERQALYGKRVLVVDDDQMNRTIMTFKLQRAQEFKDFCLTCEEASSGEEALEMFTSEWEPHHDHSRVWDMILMDEHLSVGSESSLLGSEVIQRFRQAGYKGLVISCTGNCTEHDREAYIAAGADAVWPKPYPAPPEMLKDLHVWIGQKKKTAIEGGDVLQHQYGGDVDISIYGEDSDPVAVGQQAPTPSAISACL